MFTHKIMNTLAILTTHVIPMSHFREITKLTTDQETLTSLIKTNNQEQIYV